MVSVSITGIDAASINEYPYILYDDGTGTIIISDTELQYAQIGETGWNPVTVQIGTWVNTPIDDTNGPNDNDNSDYYWGTSGSRAYGYTLIPQMIDGTIVYDVNKNWYGIITSNGNISKSIFIIEPQYTFPTGELYGNYNPTGWGEVLALPDNIAGKTVEEIIEEQTAITTIGEQAQAIQDESVQALNDYNDGTITQTELNTILTDNEAELTALSENSAASIGDLIVINNAITQNQTIQQISNKDEIVNKLNTENEELKALLNDTLLVNSTLRSRISTYVQNANYTYQYWYQGSYTQDYAMNSLKGSLNSIRSYVTDSAYQSIADQEYMNNALIYVQGLIDTIYKSNDLKKTVSSEAQTSIAEENEYFNELLAETSSSIADMSPSNEITSEEMNVAMEIVNGVWENPIIKKLLPLTCCFLVICVALGIKYRL